MLHRSVWFIFLLLAGILLLTACHNNDDSEDPSPVTQFTNGFFITNEGSFTMGSGSVSYYNRSTEEVTNDIYYQQNTTPLGSVVQSIYATTDYAYIVVNNAEKIVVVNAANMEQVGIIAGLAQPRYFLPVSAEKAYVSQWGSDGATGSIKVIDLSTNSIVHTIDSRPGPERMIRHGNYVYVAHSGGYVLDSVTCKIDVNTDQIVSTIKVGYSPQSIQEDVNGHLWVLSRGHDDFMDDTNDRDGSLVRLIDDALDLSIPVALGAHDLVINNEGNALYFIDGPTQMVFQYSIDNNTLSADPFTSYPVTSLGLDPVTDLLIGLDAKDYQINGDLIFFDGNGEITNSLEVGLIPSYLWF